jgi:hypothetical protein
VDGRLAGGLAQDVSEEQAVMAFQDERFTPRNGEQARFRSDAFALPKFAPAAPPKFGPGSQRTSRPAQAPAAPDTSGYTSAYQRGLSLPQLHQQQAPPPPPPQYSPQFAQQQHAAQQHVQHQRPAPARPAPPSMQPVFRSNVVAYEEPRGGITQMHVAGVLIAIVFVWLMAGANGARPSLSVNPAATQRLPMGVSAPKTTEVAAAAVPAKAPGKKQTLALRAPDAPIKMKGIPSPAAAASIARQRLGKKDRLALDARIQASGKAIPMDGIPSPAAAATMDTRILPLKADSDGMTLPPPDQTDGYGAYSHYTPPRRSSGALVDVPLTTPGAAGADPAGGGTGIVGDGYTVYDDPYMM